MPAAARRWRARDVDIGTLKAAQTGERRVRVQVDDLGAEDPLSGSRVPWCRGGARGARQRGDPGPTREAGARHDRHARSGGPADPVARPGLLTYELTVTNRGLPRRRRSSSE